MDDVFAFWWWQILPYMLLGHGTVSLLISMLMENVCFLFFYRTNGIIAHLSLAFQSLFPLLDPL